MAFTDEEQMVWDELNKRDLLDLQNATYLIEFCRNVYARDYSERKPLIDICNKIKNKCMQMVLEATQKELTIEEQEHIYEVNDIFWAIIKMEAQNLQFDSYCLYLEKNRDPKEKFYQPRRKIFRKHGIVQAYQRILDDDKLKLLGISLPPSTGKAQPLYSKVLTPDGFKHMGDIHVGDTVIAGNGNKSMVIGVYPQGVKENYEITLETGEKCECSREHLWYVRNADTHETSVKKTRKIEKSFELGDRYEIPVYENGKQCWSAIESCLYTGEEECQCIMIDDPCHLYITDDYIITHNTTLEKYFHSALCGWFPGDGNLFYSHSGDITRMYYDGVYDIVTNGTEYTWGEIFPGLHVTNTNAKLEQFNVGNYKPFPNVQCTSIGANNAGKVRASRFLLVDDMIGSQEQALNKNYLEKLWMAYTVDARQRKTISTVDGWDCKEIHNATRWSTVDPLGRLYEKYKDDESALFISVPALDEKTDTTNFMYDVGGFTTAHYHDLRSTMDDISWNCLFQQHPVEREGLLYQDDELRRFVDLPNREPDAVLGICDTKEKGIDYMFLPIFYKYDNDYFLVDCICDDNSDFGTQYGRLTDIILRHNVQQVEFESNQGGSRIAFEVQKRVKDQGGMCNITTKPTETYKETRILVNSDWVKQNCLFLEKTEYTPKSDYGRMMGFLLGYSVAGKNKHDDVPDGMANFALFVSRKLNVKQTRIIQSPF